jgi:hypothetical protein
VALTAGVFSDLHGIIDATTITPHYGYFLESLLAITDAFAITRRCRYAPGQHSDDEQASQAGGFQSTVGIIGLAFHN